MKSIVILIALAALGIVPAAHAQSDKSPAATQASAVFNRSRTWVCGELDSTL